MTHEETIEELLHVVLAGIDMRTAQAVYFKSRSTPDLIASKNAEQRFDRLAAAVVHLHTRDRAHFMKRESQ
jgi:hypothetical protein